VLIGVLAIWRLLENRKSGYPAQDERTRQITGRAATYAFSIGNYFMLALMMANILSRELLGEYLLLDVGYALIASVLVQSLMFLGLRWHFNRAGAV
jgi:hypothetical protein